MPYAIRNEKGEIIALTSQPNRENDVKVTFSDPDVIEFLTRDASGNIVKSKFHELLMHDLQQIRILEDLIDLLIEKDIILFSELPQTAQEKLLHKKMKREDYLKNNTILVDDAPIF